MCTLCYLLRLHIAYYRWFSASRSFCFCFWFCLFCLQTSFSIHWCILSHENYCPSQIPWNKFYTFWCMHFKYSITFNNFVLLFFLLILIAYYRSTYKTMAVILNSRSSVHHFGNIFIFLLVCRPKIYERQKTIWIEKHFDRL